MATKSPQIQRFVNLPTKAATPDARLAGKEVELYVKVDDSHWSTEKSRHFRERARFLGIFSVKDSPPPSNDR